MARAAVVLGAIAVLALSACNAILGMEHARLDEGVDSGAPANHGSGGKPAVVQPSGTGAVVNTVEQADCTTESDTCQKCIEGHCGGATQSEKCLKDPACRGVIQSHTLCLGNFSCRSSECSAILTDNLEDGANAQFASCVNQCGLECDGKGLFPICELYCSCMMATCPDQASTLGASLDECVQKCNSDKAIHDNASCRENHCEIAKIALDQAERDRHCLHSLGQLGNCAGKIKICTSGFASGNGPCKSGDDCCSKRCNADHICQD
jgi:hypothetical protein